VSATPDPAPTGAAAAEEPVEEPVEEQWRVVDEGWGRRAVDFATLAEPTNVREYVAVHHRLGVGEGDRLLDVACGSGLAVELATLRGARCAGIDASPRLIAVARDRNPQADLRVGDMNALPWNDGSFDVVTSFRGIWGTTPGALAEVHRVLAPGGRVAFTVWGHIRASPGAWIFAPFLLATEAKVENQANMVALGRPGAGEALLEQTGFTDVERVDLSFVFEFADPEAYARALASTGPAYEAIQAAGEEAFLEMALDLGRERVREGLPLRAPVLLVGYLASKAVRPSAAGEPSPVGDDGDVAAVSRRDAGFLAAAPDTPEAQELFDGDVQGSGFVMNTTRLWAYLPSALDGLSDLMDQVTRAGSLSLAQRSVLVSAAASALGDSYCSLAWGKRLADAAGPDVAAAVIRGTTDGLDDADQALARWARLVATDPNGIDAGDVQTLRDAGFDDQQIFAITSYVAFRLAFSTVNDALGAHPDEGLGATVPDEVRAAVDFGRPVEAGQSPPEPAA
jgi:uncharacterized peroxidase-related enzyme